MRRHVVYLVNPHTDGHIRMVNPPARAVQFLRDQGYEPVTREEYYAAQRRLRRREAREAARQWREEKQ